MNCNTMTKEWYLKRINNIDVNSIRNLGSNSLARLTCNFNPLFVGKLILRGASVSQQRFILQYIDTKYIKWVNETKPKSEPALYYELIKDVNLSLDCGMIIKPEELDKFISDAENNTITDVKKSETISALEARIKELVEENEKLNSENKELKEQQPIENPAEGYVESLKQRIAELEGKIADLEEREGIDAPKAALLVRIACTKLGGMPNNRENAWPLISNLWGTAEASARKRLRERVKEETVEDLASLFDSVSPKIAGIIREEGKVIIEKQKKVK